MTSIGLLLVVMSIGLPQRRHITVIGDPGAARTGPSGGGGAGCPRGPPSMPGPARRHIARTATSRRITRRESATAYAGTPPTSVDQKEAAGPTWTIVKAPAPVLNSLTMSRRSPEPRLAGTVRKRSACWYVVMALALPAPNNVAAKRNCDGRLDVPRAAMLTCTRIVSPAAYEPRSREMLITYPPAWEIVSADIADRPLPDAVAVKVYARLAGFGVSYENHVLFVAPEATVVPSKSTTVYVHEGFVITFDRRPKYAVTRSPGLYSDRSRVSAT